jgi:hypothetical protein
MRAMGKKKKKRKKPGKAAPRITQLGEEHAKCHAELAAFTASKKPGRMSVPLPWCLFN